MANLAKTLKLLRQEQKQAQRQVEKLKDAIRVIEELVGRHNGRGAGRPKRKMSPAARRRIAQAQKARWAKWRKGKR